MVATDKPVVAYHSLIDMAVGSGVTGSLKEVSNL